MIPVAAAGYPGRQFDPGAESVESNISAGGGGGGNDGGAGLDSRDGILG